MRMKVVDLIVVLYISIGVFFIILGNVVDVIALIVLGITTILLPIINLGVSYLSVKKRVHKPTDSEWDNLKTQKCYHITYKKNLNKIDEGNGNIYLKTTKSFTANVATLFKPSVFFFIGEPNVTSLKRNDINSDRKYVISVDISALDRNRIRIRTFDNVLIYIGPYKGSGCIKEREMVFNNTDLN